MHMTGKKKKDFLSSFNARKGGVNTSSPLRLKFKFNTTRKRSWTRVVGSIFFYFHDGEQRADNLTVYRYHQQPIFMQLAICIYANEGKDGSGGYVKLAFQTRTDLFSLSSVCFYLSKNGKMSSLSCFCDKRKVDGK